jgi:hypothetical protein
MRTDCMSLTPPRRRWFQFGLRTMFVAVTLFSLWLGWELKFIRDRRAFLAAMDDLRITEPQNSTSAFGLGFTWTDQSSGASIPFWRRWLGDEPQTVLALPSTSTEADRETAVKLFPEAKVHRID